MDNLVEKAPDLIKKIDQMTDRMMNEYGDRWDTVGIQKVDRKQ